MEVLEVKKAALENELERLERRMKQKNTEHLAIKQRNREVLKYI